MTQYSIKSIEKYYEDARCKTSSLAKSSIAGRQKFSRCETIDRTISIEHCMPERSLSQYRGLLGQAHGNVHDSRRYLHA